MSKVSERIERQMIGNLRPVMREVIKIIKRHMSPADGSIIDEPGLTRALAAYSDKLGGWATGVVDRMLTDSERHARRELAAQIGRKLAVRLARQELSDAARAMRAEQIDLLVHIPQRAGEIMSAANTRIAAARARDLADIAARGGADPSVMEEKIRELGERGLGAMEYTLNNGATINRAKLIARTECAKANALMGRENAAEIGATHYVWRTMSDKAVRDSHADLEGKVFAYDDLTDKDGEGATGPGEIYNCRCYAESIIPK